MWGPRGLEHRGRELTDNPRGFFEAAVAPERGSKVSKLVSMCRTSRVDGSAFAVAEGRRVRERGIR
jgi:hypothetical protein